MKDFFISAGRVCFVISVVCSCLATVYQAIMAMLYIGFFWGVATLIGGFFTIILICYIVALLENIYERTGRHDRLFDAQLGELTRIKKELEKGLQGIEEIKTAQKTGRHDRLVDTQLSEITRIGKDLEKGLHDIEEIKNVQNSQNKHQADSADSAPASSWSTGIKHS